MSTNPVTDTVIRLTIKQGKESERLSNVSENVKFQISDTFDEGTFNSYEYFPSGELIYTRDTGRVFVGNNTYPTDIENYKIKLTNQITPGGTLVGNKYLGQTILENGNFAGELAFDGYHNKISEYNTDYKAYNGDYIFDTKNYALILFDKNSKIKEKYFDNLKGYANIVAKDTIGTGYTTFISAIPEGEFLDYDSIETVDGKFRQLVEGMPHILKLKKIDFKLLKDHFDISTTPTELNGFYIKNNKIHSYVHDKIEQSSLSYAYKQSKLTKNRVVINNKNGDFTVHNSVSDTELEKLNGLITYKNSSNTNMNLQNIIGHPYWAGTRANDNTNGEAVYNRQSTSKYNTAYDTIWGNIGSTEWTDGTNRGGIWANIGNSSNFVGSSDGGGKNSKDTQTATVGLSHYDHNIKNNKAVGNPIDIWYNIGNPLAHANIWKYENGKRTNTKQISGNVVPYSSNSSGYRYQNLWECIGARKPSATTASHYNLWNHIGDNTSYTTKFSDLSWPASTAKPVPTVISKDYSLSSLKTTIWGAINQLRSHVGDLYEEIKNACSKLTSYIDNQITNLSKKIDNNSKIYTRYPNYFSKYTEYISDRIERFELTVPEDGWLFCGANGPDGQGGSNYGLQIFVDSPFGPFEIFSIVGYTYGHPSIMLPVTKGLPLIITTPNNCKLYSVRFFKNITEY